MQGGGGVKQVSHLVRGGGGHKNVTPIWGGGGSKKFLGIERGFDPPPPYINNEHSLRSNWIQFEHCTKSLGSHISS